MARKRRQTETRVCGVPGSEDQIVGWRFIRQIEEQLQALRDAEAHGNRVLHGPHVLVAHLIAFFNPALESLRDLEDVFESKRMRRRFGLPRVPKSTLSDAQRLLDATLLVPLIDSLKRRVKLGPHDPRLDGLTRDLIAVDGTFFTLAARVVWALFNKSKAIDAAPRKGNVRADVHFDVLRGVPEYVTVTDGRTPEHATLGESYRAGCLYVLDRGFQCYQVLADIVDADSDFLVRLRAGVQFEVLEDRRLTGADRAAGVESDASVRIRSARADGAFEDLPLRCVHLAGDDGQTVILLTNRLDLSADLLALLYRHRWQVELFFRWLKCMVNFRHFYSESPEGITLQVYAAIIGTLLIALEAGSKPSRYDYVMMTHVVNGLIPLAEARAILTRRRAERAQAAAWQKAYNARKKKAQ